MLTKKYEKEVKRMRLDKVFSHMIEDCAINRTKQLICFNPYLTTRQKQFFNFVLNVYSNAKKINSCLISTY